VIGGALDAVANVAYVAYGAYVANAISLASIRIAGPALCALAGGRC
jgi:hypothetical protein